MAAQESSATMLNGVGGSSLSLPSLMKVEVHLWMVTIQLGS